MHNMVHKKPTPDVYGGLKDAALLWIWFQLVLTNYLLSLCLKPG